MEIVAVAPMHDWRVAGKLEAEDLAVELHGRAHVKDLEGRAEAVEINGHEPSLSNLNGNVSFFKGVKRCDERLGCKRYRIRKEYRPFAALKRTP